jgi:hypothetical protein
MALVGSGEIELDRVSDATCHVCIRTSERLGSVFGCREAHRPERRAMGVWMRGAACIGTAAAVLLFPVAAQAKTKTVHMGEPSSTVKKWGSRHRCS